MITHLGQIHDPVWQTVSECELRDAARATSAPRSEGVLQAQDEGGSAISSTHFLCHDLGQRGQDCEEILAVAAYLSGGYPGGQRRVHIGRCWAVRRCAGKKEDE